MVLNAEGQPIGGQPCALDIADAVFCIAANLAANNDPALRGLFHMAGAGETHWAGFAEAIFAESAARGGPSARVRPITTADYPTPAKRPANSRLDCSKLAAIHGVHMPQWRASLAAVIARMVG